MPAEFSTPQLFSFVPATHGFILKHILSELHISKPLLWPHVTEYMMPYIPIATQKIT